MRSSPGRIRVLVVDDSVVIRRLVTEALASDRQIEVVGIAQNGQVAIERIKELAPDAVTMDIEMPVMNGIEAVRVLRRNYPRLPVVMFSTLTERGASATLDALAAGASDYVTKPSNVGSFAESQKNIRDELIPKLKALTGTYRAASSRRQSFPAPTPAASGRKRSRGGPYQVLAIGSSTGGPDALSRVLSSLPSDLAVPVMVVQHMPPLFTRLLAQRLGQNCRVKVMEAGEGEPLAAGTVMIAPGGQHLTVRRQGPTAVAHLTEDPPENFCRPAVDVLFRSAASLYADRVLAVVLTGMGRDGAAGAKMIRDAGGEVLVQDEATSVVWGMPGAVAMSGQADQVLALERIGPDVVAALSRSPAPVGVAP